MKVRVIRVRKWQPGFTRKIYKKKVSGPKLLSPRASKAARRAGLRPDRSLRKGFAGTWRKGRKYLVWNDGRPKVKVRKDY